LHHRSDHGPTNKTNPEIQTGKELQKIQSNAPVNKKKRQRKELVLASIGHRRAKSTAAEVEVS
jgi:hypothetical protein